MLCHFQANLVKRFLKMDMNLRTNEQSISDALDTARELVICNANELQIDFDEIPREIEISKLRKTAYHNRVIISERYQSILQSLKEFGFIGAIFINAETNAIIDGWYRTEIWESLGHNSIPCFTIKCNSQQEQSLYLRLNTQAATFDFTEYGLTLPKLNLISDYGFTAADLKEIDHTIIPPETPRRPENNNGLKKLSALLNHNVYVRLNAIKEQTKVENWSDVIEILIETYENLQH
jgi:hypothetical protein